jgi:hypothetical protein
MTAHGLTAIECDTATSALVTADAPSRALPLTRCYRFRPDTDTSGPVFTTAAGEVILTVIEVRAGGLVGYQCYAVTADTWELVGIHLLYVDALRTVAGFKRYVAEGGTVTDWQAAHPDGITPHR